ncbi:hypothetical protein AYI69_g7962 [Smittium culicis]|uniref:Uncharacterized protein n=1 Tax=Smittium culicis TaxID=133412 RepID=A0A1R1XN94_9FUNG|nr:hypothetical protein AYI69_g7962 [Smittium culicis]
MKLLESKFKRSTQRLKICKESETPASRLRPLQLKGSIPLESESYKYGSWDLSPENQAWVGKHDCAHKLESQLSAQIAKDDKLLSEAEQYILDLARIGAYIEDVSREFRNIIEPKEPEIMLFVDEISGSSQDLVRLALHYAQKWKTSRRISICQSSGYEKILPLQTLDPISQSTNTYSIPVPWKNWKLQDSQAETTNCLEKRSAASLATTIRVNSTTSISLAEVTPITGGAAKTDGEVALNGAKLAKTATIEVARETETNTPLVRSYSGTKVPTRVTARGFRVDRGKICKLRSIWKVRISSKTDDMDQPKDDGQSPQGKVLRKNRKFKKRGKCNPKPRKNIWRIFNHGPSVHRPEKYFFTKKHQNDLISRENRKNLMRKNGKKDRQPIALRVTSKFPRKRENIFKKFHTDRPDRPISHTAVGNRHIEIWVQNPIRTTTIPYSKEYLQSSRDSPACYQLDGPEIFGFGDNQSSLGSKPNICLTNIWQGRTGEDTPAVGYEAYKRIRHKGKFQDERYQISERNHTTWRFYHKAGYKICLSPGSFTSKFGKNVPLHAQRDDILVPLAAIWTNYGAESVHQNYEICNRAAQIDCNTLNFLHRRHSNSRRISGGIPETHSDNSEAHGETWVHYEPRKISFHSEKTSEIPRSCVRHPENVDTFNSGKNKENQKRSPQSHTPSESQLQLQRALTTLSIYTEQSEVVGYPIKPLELVATDIEDLKSKLTRICYNGCFWNRLGNNKQRYDLAGGWSQKNQTESSNYKQAVLFSNTRPKFNGYGCSRQSLAEIRGLCKPTPTLTTPNSASSSDGNYTDGNYSTELDSSTMVPIITEDGCMPSYDTTGGAPLMRNLLVENIRESPQKLSHVCLAADK